MATGSSQSAASRIPARARAADVGRIRTASCRYNLHLFLQNTLDAMLVLFRACVVAVIVRVAVVTAMSALNMEYVQQLRCIALCLLQ